ncbi:hypothetical protein NDU88_004806 [Pleurodeles waltl]|uniref:Uncharacterized protein n=1 Tax=Pleurodeles waltl TaxID=8319 RepID=A0AAV7LL53_PLEWA|nr:hypothetical protein NDU88_004806 [Pleurodeles waltl]
MASFQPCPGVTDWSAQGDGKDPHPERTPVEWAEQVPEIGRGMADRRNDWSGEESQDYRNSERKRSRERTDGEQNKRGKENSAVCIQGRNREPSGIEEKRRAAWDNSDPWKQEFRRENAHLYTLNEDTMEPELQFSLR